MRMRPILLSLLLAAAVPAFAAEPAPAPEVSPEAVPSTREADATDPATRPEADRHCLRETGTRIRLRGERRACAPFAGRVWTRDDLQRTGQVDIGTALRMLDVSIR